MPGLQVLVNGAVSWVNNGFIQDTVSLFAECGREGTLHLMNGSQVAASVEPELSLCYFYPFAFGKIEYIKNSWVWWCTPVIPVLGRLKQEDCRFETSLSNLARPCFKIKKQKGLGVQLRGRDRMPLG